MADKAYFFDPVDSPTLMLADVSAIREFIRQYQEYKTVWAERVAEGVAKTRKPKSVLQCTDPDLWNRIRKYEMELSDQDFTSEALVIHLKEKVSGAAVVVSLKDIHFRQFDV